MIRRVSVLVGLACIVIGLCPALAQSPPAPTNLVATLVKTLPPSVGLTWEASRPAALKSFFKVYRSLEDSFHFNLLAVAPDTAYNDRAVSPGHVYYYRVTMVVLLDDSTVRESPPSNTASVEFPPPPGKPHGLIIGSVTDSVTGKPLSHILMMFFCRSHTLLWIQQTWTDSLGRYAAVLDTGYYLILAQPQRLPWASTMLPPYRPQWYDHAYDVTYASPVKADSPASVANFELSRIAPPPIAQLSGFVRDSGGNPLANAFVAVMRPPWELALSGAKLGMADLDGNEDCEVEEFGYLRGVVWKGWTGTDGKYTAALPAGRSYIAMAVKREYLPQFYDHKPCILQANVIRIPLTTRDTSGFDFNLMMRPILANSVSGIVRDTGGVRVPSFILLLPLRGQGPGPVVRFGSTDQLGAYTIRFVPTGKYLALAIPYTKYAPAFYKKGAYGVFRWRDADTILVSGAVTNIDIGVVPVHCGGVAMITGRVSSGGMPVEGAVVLASDAQGNVVGYGMTGDDGSYSLDGVPPGDLTLSVDREGYQTGESPVAVGMMDFTVHHDFTLETVTAVGAVADMPAVFALEQNYPNPFNPSTTVGFSLPATSRVSVKVFNLVGQEVATLADGTYDAGRHRVTWNGRDNLGRPAATGIYFCRMQANDLKGGSVFTRTMKMLYLR